MILKSFPLSLINFGSATLCTVLASMFSSLASPVRAQTTGTDTAKPKPAFVRFWDMLPGPASTVLVLTSGDKPISDASSCNFLARYVPVTAGAYTFVIRRGNDSKATLKPIPANLMADAKVTILVTGTDNQPNVQLIDDTIDSRVAPTGRLAVRQFVSNAKVTVSTAAGAITPVLGYDEVSILDNLPLAESTVTTKISAPGKPDKLMSMAVDLTQNPHGTLLIFQDSYGSVRPRFAVDGQAVVDQGRGAGGR